jgi:hypothetical protein
MSENKQQLKISVKLIGIQAQQLKAIMEEKGFTMYSEAIRATILYYYDNKINKPLDNGEKDEDSMDNCDQ